MIFIENALLWMVVWTKIELHEQGYDCLKVSWVAKVDFKVIIYCMLELIDMTLE